MALWALAPVELGDEVALAPVPRPEPVQPRLERAWPVGAPVQVPDAFGEAGGLLVGGLGALADSGLGEALVDADGVVGVGGGALLGKQQPQVVAALTAGQWVRKGFWTRIPA